MRILFITENLEPNSGWGRYSADLIVALEAKQVEICVCQIKDPLRFKKHFFLGWWQALVLHFRYRSQKFDIIHCVVEPYSFITLILSKLKKIPYVITFHGTYAVRFMPHFAYGRMQRLAYRKAGALIAVSNYTKNKILKYASGLKIGVIPNGVSQKFLDSADSLETQKDNMILTVAPFKERKGLYFLAESLPEIFAQIPGASWVLVGKTVDKKYKAKIKEFLTAHGIVDRCQFLENISDEELHGLYRKARVFALTSSSSEFEFEGFGLVYLEANAFNVPTIGAYGSGAEEAINHGHSGFLINQSDSGSIARQIIELLVDKESYSRLRKGAREWAEEHSSAKIVGDYLVCYKELTQNK